METGKCSLGFVLVIAVILGVLGMVMFPMFARTGGHARQDACLNNLKQCAQSLNLYAHDYNGQMPSSYLLRHSKRWSQRESLVFCTGAGYLAEFGSVQNGTWPVLLRSYLKVPDIALCPSDEVADPGPTTPVSYWYKVANDKAWYGIGCQAPRRSTKDYGYEADQIAFYERLGWHSGDASGLKEGIQISAAYIDTHVETIVIQNATTGDPINCAANSDGEPMYYNTQVRNGTPRKQTGPAKFADPTFCYDQL